MRTICLAALLIAASATADAAERRLTLADAVELAMRIDPLVAEARIAEDRGKLAVLRAQLDRVSLKIDGQLQELWNQTNIGGPPIHNCTYNAFGDTLTQTGISQNECEKGLMGKYGLASDQAPQGLFNLSARLDVPIFSGLRVESTVANKKLVRDAALVTLRQQRKDTALSVARAYWAVRRLAILRDVQADAVKRLSDSELVTEARVKAGLAPPIDKNRAKLRRLQQVSGLEDLNGQLQEAAVQLGVTLGISDPLVLVDEPNVPETLPPPADELLEDARAGRPELQVARLQLRAQHFAVRIARSNYYPQLGAFGLFQYGNNPYIPGSGSRAASDTANPFSNLSGNLTVGGTLTMNFFDTLNTYTLSRDAEYEESRLAAEKTRVERVVESDVRTAHAKVLHLYAKRAPLITARDVARDNVTILEARYKNGDALVIEFLDAQNDLGNAEQNLADATAQLYLAWLELQASLGKTVGAR
jgi:outer membrane protein TolC